VEQLDELGAQGWELVSVVLLEAGFVTYLKRPA
jgi:hypothetical protein